MRQRKRKQGVPMEAQKIREILRLWDLKFNQTMIAQGAAVSRAAVQDYTRRARAAALTIEEVRRLDDAELLKRLRKDGGHRRRVAVEIDYKWVSAELRKKGVTLELLFRELLAQERMPVSYATFCRRVQEQSERSEVVMHQSYTPGEYWLIDYSGLTVPIWNECVDTIECKAQVFVGVLGASGKLFCEATPSQAIEHFLGSHVRAFEYYGGVPRVTIPDNLKSGVTKATWHEPALTRAYQELAAHYLSRRGWLVIRTQDQIRRD